MEEDNFELTDVILKNMASAKIDHDHKTAINSVDFSDDGSWIVTCDDYSLNLYDAVTSKRLKTLNNKISKIEMVKFTHNNNGVLCATKSDHKILYWSTFENEVLKTFQGHDDQIICLEINPVNDYFLSSGKDQKFKLWDLAKKDPLPIAMLDLSSKNSIVVGNFDSAGVIFAIAYREAQNSNKIRLYDIDRISEGSFNTFTVDCNEIRIVKFSNSGNYVLLSTSENQLYILDAYEGDVKFKLTDHLNENGLTLEASFTPDSKYVISGSEDGCIYIWNIEGDKERFVTKLEAHYKPSACVKFSPTYVMMVSACKNLIFWLPKDFN